MSPAYLAGFFDGEGSIMMVTNGPTRPHLVYPRLNISNTWRQGLEEIAQAYGGRVKVKNYNHARPNWKPAYAWTTTSLEQTERVLRILYPFLRVKKEQAEAVLAWFDLRRNGQLTQDISRAYRAKVMLLNTRGRAIA